MRWGERRLNFLKVVILWLSKIPHLLILKGLEWLGWDGLLEQWNIGELVALNATSVGVGKRNRSFLCMCSRNCIFDIFSSEKTFWLTLLKFDKWNVWLTFLKVDKKKLQPSEAAAERCSLRLHFLNFKNIRRGILSRKSLVKYLSSIYIPTFQSWFPEFSSWFLTFPP